MSAADVDGLTDEMATADRALATASAEDVISWAAGRFGHGLAAASSFQDAVLIDLCSRVGAMPVVFLDTHFHFPETIAYMRRVRDRYGLDLVVLEPAVGKDVSPCGSIDCCAVRKVAPLDAYLASKSAWITGLKRVDTPERDGAPVVSYDAARAVAKINPLAAWTDDDVERYEAAHDLPRHPLTFVGYRSIGCAPTTRPVGPGEDPRAGRWPESDKTECGLHI